MNFWSTIVESNTFNFAILVLIFALLWKKLNISSAIESIKDSVIKTIDNAKSEFEASQLKLKNAEISTKNLENEINEIKTNAEKQAEGLSKSIIENSDKQVLAIAENIEKIISAEEKSIIRQASDRTLKISVELAKEHITKVLNSNPELHYKYIEESLEELC